MTQHIRVVTWPSVGHAGVFWPHYWKDQMPLDMGITLASGHILLDGHSSLRPCSCSPVARPLGRRVQ